MTQETPVILHPFGVLKEAAVLWVRNIVVASGLGGVGLFFGRILFRLVQPVGVPGCGGVDVRGAFFFGGAFFVFLVLNSFLCLLILGIFRQHKQQPLLATLRETVKVLPAYLKAIFSLWGFVLAVAALAYLFLVGGNIFYAGPAPQGLKMVMLVAASTVFVVLLIAGAWYGLFLSLAPVIAAFEGRTVWDAFKLSLHRIRGNAARYLAVFVLLGLIYAGLALTGYHGAGWLAGRREALSPVEAIAGILVGPVWLAAWLVAYQKLTVLKETDAKASPSKT